MKSLLPITFLLFSFLSKAQNINNNKYEADFSFNFTLAEPRGFFNDNISGMPYGLNTSLAIGRIISVGFDYTHLFLGGKRENIIVTSPGLFGNINEPALLKIKSNANHFKLFVRLSSPSGNLIQMYADGFAGISSFTTRTDIEYAYNNEDYTNYRSELDFGTLYGGRAGLRVRVSENNNLAIYINAHAEAVYGSRVEYGVPNSIEILPDYSTTYTLDKTRTDLYSFNLGVAFILR